MKAISLIHVATVGAFALAVAGCGGGSKTASAPSLLPSVATRQAAQFAFGRPAHPTFSAPLLPPPGTIYLGAYVNLGGHETVQQQIVSTAKFETSINRTLAIDMHYHQWSEPLISVAEQDDAAHGRIPLVSWACGDLGGVGVKDADIAAGLYDARIKQGALSVKKFGRPIFLRYKWEFNLLYNTKCADPAHDIKDTNGQPRYSPTEFVAAWNHIRAVFAANGAKNVVWLWNPSGNVMAPDAYYPGDAQVDWIGTDWYDSFNLYFTDIYDMTFNTKTGKSVWTYPYLSTHWPNKPLMISETGAVQTWQVNYFAGDATHPCADASLQQNFQNIQAYVYWDSTGSRGNFQIIAALQNFKAFADLPYESGSQP